MKYYLIAGEASGDLHAAHLMRELKKRDAQARFMFIGGDNMAAEGGIMANHYRNLAYMGFVPVLLHSYTILANMRLCKRDIAAWRPDVVILIDYPGFNLSIAKYVKAKLGIPVFYYISPKIWAWKEWRIKNIRRDVDEMFSILPFEIDFYEKKHHYPIHYVGNPTADEVAEFKSSYTQSFSDFCNAEGLCADKKIIALLAGSRRQEIKDNLPAMIAAAELLQDDYQLVVAGAPSIERSYYDKFMGGKNVAVVENKTFQLLCHSAAALVTSGTATLETALFGVPQVVCYKTPVPRLIRFAFNHVIKVDYISLVNLVADKEVVRELLADRFTVENIREELLSVLSGGRRRAEMLEGYEIVRSRLGNERASVNAAAEMKRILDEKYKRNDQSETEKTPNKTR